MVKQSFFESDTDTLLRFSQHLNQLTSQDSIGLSPKEAPFIDGYLNPQPQVIADVPDRGDDADATSTYANCVCLNLETLKCFEVVERQYEELGVI